MLTKSCLVKCQGMEISRLTPQLLLVLTVLLNPSLKSTAAAANNAWMDELEEPQAPPPAAISCAFNSVRRVNASEFLGIVTAEKVQEKNGSYIFANFYSLNCPFSKKLAPIFSQLPAAFPSIRFYRFNAAKEPHLNLRYGVFGYPSLIAFKNGIVSRRFDGPYNLTDLERFVHDVSSIPAIGNISRLPSPTFVDDEKEEKDLFLYFSLLVTALLPLEFMCRRIWS
jgi:thiol-disulfide isomerase/thioredoxin